MFFWANGEDVADEPKIKSKSGIDKIYLIINTVQIKADSKTRNIFASILIDLSEIKKEIILDFIFRKTCRAIISFPEKN